MIAIRTNHTAAEAMGVNTALYKALTFGLSAFYTGIAGALSAIVVEFVSPDSFTFFLSIWLLLGMVVGGLGSIWGAVFGGWLATNLLKSNRSNHSLETKKKAILGSSENQNTL